MMHVSTVRRAPNAHADLRQRRLLAMARSPTFMVRHFGNNEPFDLDAEYDSDSSSNSGSSDCGDESTLGDDSPLYQELTPLRRMTANTVEPLNPAPGLHRTTSTASDSPAAPSMCSSWDDASSTGSTPTSTPASVTPAFAIPPSTKSASATSAPAWEKHMMRVPTKAELGEDAPYIPRLFHEMREHYHDWEHYFYEVLVFDPRDAAETAYVKAQAAIAERKTTAAATPALESRPLGFPTFSARTSSESEPVTSAVVADTGIGGPAVYGDTLVRRDIQIPNNRRAPEVLAAFRETIDRLAASRRRAGAGDFLRGAGVPETYDPSRQTAWFARRNLDMAHELRQNRHQVAEAERAATEAEEEAHREHAEAQAVADRAASEAKAVVRALARTMQGLIGDEYDFEEREAEEAMMKEDEDEEGTSCRMCQRPTTRLFCSQCTL